MSTSLTEVPTEAQREPWFDDGNLILLTDDNCAFRIHRGVLARQSEIFRTMLDMPQPADAMDVEILHGCQVVRMYDISSELSSLLKAIYDGITFQTRSIEDFFLLASILRLSTKYFIGHLRSQAIAQLTRTWSHTLKGHDTMVDLALKSPIANDISFPYAHPLHVLNLAREVNIRLVVPSAVYFLSIYPFSDLLRADHPKLLIDSPSKPSSHLSYEDTKNYILMFQHRIDLIVDFSRRFCGERKAGKTCQREQRCTYAFARLASVSSRSWVTRTGPLHWMLQAVKQLDSDDSVCVVCKREFRDDVHAHRVQVWNALPGIIGLPEWEVLLEADTSASDLVS